MIALTYDDIIVEPRQSDVKRSQLSAKPRQIKDIHTSLPIISSPMSTVTGKKMVDTMNSLGCLGAHHRYCDLEILLETSHDNPSHPIAVGTLEKHQSTIDALLANGHHFFMVDVAHGGHIKAIETIRYIRSKDKDCVIMSGNLTDTKSAQMCIDAGADLLRVGIGSGSVCSTRINIGVGLPSVTCLWELSEYLEKTNQEHILLVADGGIKNTGDINKALVCGADYVILGSMLAGSDDTPGDIKYYNGPNGKWTRGKAYNGMASAQELIENNGKNPDEAMVEGVSTMIPYKGSTRKIINNIKLCIEQCLFYTGCFNIEELQTKANVRQISPASYIEGTPHGSK